MGADADAMPRIEIHIRAQEVDGDGGLLIGEHGGEGGAGVVVDSDLRGLEALVRIATAAASTIATTRNSLKTGHLIDIEVQQIAGRVGSS